MNRFTHYVSTITTWDILLTMWAIMIAVLVFHNGITIVAMLVANFLLIAIPVAWTCEVASNSRRTAILGRSFSFAR
jgi:hypothetical protein